LVGLLKGEGMVLAGATVFLQSPGMIHHISNFLIMMHHVWPVVATYGSCFQACRIIASKNSFKDEFQVN
jgi:hypothetical protein